MCHARIAGLGGEDLPEEIVPDIKIAAEKLRAASVRKTVLLSDIAARQLYPPPARRVDEETAAEPVKTAEEDGPQEAKAEAVVGLDPRPKAVPPHATYRVAAGEPSLPNVAEVQEGIPEGPRPSQEGADLRLRLANIGLTPR